MSGRCKACNSILKEGEMVWKEELKTHEDLCLKCRNQIYDIAIEDLEVLDKLTEEGY